jgi:hypothetical protein
MGLFDGLIKKSWESNLIEKAKKEGAAEGRHGRPTPDSTAPDEKELAYSAEAYKLIIAANERVAKKIKDLAPKLATARQELNSIESKFDSRPSLEVVRNDALAVFHQGHHELVKNYYDSLNTEGSYKEFQVKHGISIPPNHPANPIDRLADILVLLVIEGALNSFFWHDNENVGTLISGVIYGVLSSIITIGVGLVSGLGFRWINRSENWAKPLAVTSLVAGIFVLFWISAWMSTQRSLSKFGDAFVDLSSIFSTLDNMALFFCGLFFGLYAIKKGYSDIYGTIPGYKEMSEHYKAAEKSVQDSLGNIRTSMQAVFDKAIGTCGSIVYSFRNLSERLANILAELNAVKQEFRATSDNILTSLRMIVGVYRSTNAAVKPTGIGTPQYFSDEVTLHAEVNSQVDVLENDAIALESQRKKLSDSMLQLAATENNLLLEEKGRILNETLTQLLAECKETARQQFLDHIANSRPFERFDNV